VTITILNNLKKVFTEEDLMRKITTLLFIVIFALLASSTLLSQQNNEDEKFQKTLDSFFDELWKFYPTAATMAGYHKYDNKLEDLSSKSIEKRHDTLDKFNEEFVTKIDRTKLSPEYQIYHLMILDAMESEFLKHENLLPWEYNPIFYNNILMNCIRSLLTKEFAPLDTRAKNAEARLKALLKLIKQAKENLKTPPQLYTETAIKQFPAISDFYKTKLPQLIEQAPAASKSKLQSNLAKVIPVLEDYQNFLQNELLPRSTGNFRLMEAHARLVRLTFQNDIPVQELAARAKADVNNIRREMALVSLPFFRIMYPNLILEQITAQRGEDETQQIAIKGVLDKLKGEHTTKDDFLNKIKTISEEIKSFITENQLVELPEGSINIKPMPLEYQGITWTRLVSPPLYETSDDFSYEITPIPDDWDEEKTTSFLEEYNNFLLYFWTVRNVYPGSYVPTFYTRQNSSLITKMYSNMPLIKGWPVYIEEMLVKNGFGNYDLRLRLNQLKYLLRGAINFIVEFNVHESSWTKEDAVAYMTRKGFQTQAEAERKWNQIILKPGESAYAYVGFQEILDMEKEYKQLKGESFSQREFLKKLLSYGALPIRELKKKILE